MYGNAYIDYVTTVVLYLHDYGSNIVGVLNVSRLTRSYQSVSDADHVSLTKPDSDQSSFKLTQVVLIVLLLSAHQTLTT